MMSLPHRLLPLLVWSAILAVSRASDPKLVDKAWDDASMLLVQESYTKFTTAQEVKGGGAREIEYGIGVNLLNLQPKTVRNINRAEAIFTRLIASNPNDEVGIASLYYLARLEQIHRNDPNVPKALQLYAQLIAEHPDHFYAQSAIAKVAILKLCATPTTADKRQALAEVEKLAHLLNEPAARCNFNLVVSTACIQYNLGDEKALRYLIEADTIGIPIQFSEANVLIRIGNLALRLGKRDIAITYFERFLKEFPRSTRAFTVQQKVKELKGAKS